MYPILYNRIEDAVRQKEKEMVMTEERKIEKPLSTKQVAEMLGLHPKTVLHMAERGEIPAYKIGELWKYKRSEIEAYFDSRRHEPEQKQAEE
jgi:excisionase family DNA binding protein